MNTLSCKAGVGFPVLRPAGFRILAALDGTCQELGISILITSGSEERGRLPTDPHMTGEGVDAGLVGFDTPMILAIRRTMQQRLGEQFTVLIESPHPVPDLDVARIMTINPSATAIHLHLQKRKNTVFP